MKHVIIGAGPAGVTAAKTIRQLRPEDEIVMLSSDRHIHSRCMLHKYIAGERDENTLSFIPEGFLEDNGITWKGGVAVTGIDTAAKKVLLGGGSESFDKLLIATGADSVIPPVGDLRTGENVYGLRSLSDAQSVREKAETADNIIIIGAGLVGLDAAYGLLELGKASTIVEMADSILSINLDPHAAQVYQQRFEDAGCTFELGRKVVNTVSQGNRITHIELDDGRQLPCDLVIAATGVRPAIQILKDSGIDCDKAVQVDIHLATSHKDIYAAGDVAGLSGIWPNAMKQGEVAGKNMCGASALYTDTYALKNTVNFFGLASLSIGRLEPNDGDVVEIREDRNCYNKVILRDGRVVGVILQGNIDHSGFWQYLIKNDIDVRSVNKPIWKLSYADFCRLEPNGEYQWAVSS